MSFLTRRRLGFCAVMLLFTILYLQFAHAQSSDGSVTATAGAPSPNSVAAGQPVTIALSATATPPTVAYPDSIVSGPEWSWKGMGPGSPQINQPDPYSANATMIVKTDQPGVYSMSATATATWTTKMGMKPSLSGMTNIVTATVVGVDRLQCLGKNGYVDIMGMMGPLFVPLGSFATFHAVPTPNGSAFPSGQPVWSGTSGATGTGDTGDTVVSFNTLSTSKSDVFTVVATCGNSYVSIDVVVFDFDGVLTPAVDFAGRSYTRFGVCETINLSPTFSPSAVTEYDVGGLDWEIISGGGEFTGGFGGTRTYACSDDPGAFVLRLFVSGGPCFGQKEKKKEVDKDAPTLVRFEKTADSKKYHLKGTASAGFKADQYFEPKDVSFDKIVWKEGFCKPSTKGGYDNDTDNNGNHPESKEWVPTIKPGDDGKGTDVGSFDLCYSSELQKADWKDDSKFTWDIPWTYFKSGEEFEADKTPKAASRGKPLFTVRQEWVSNVIGTCTISKPTLNVKDKRVEETRLEGEDTIKIK